jgi:5-methylcytosine-specific restriction endonuclease McrA
MDPETLKQFNRKKLDPKWQAKKVLILIRDNYKCRNCNSTENLQVHHRQYHFFEALKAYKDPWDYNNNLLITLCKNCHDRGHELYKVPIKHIKHGAI